MTTAHETTTAQPRQTTAQPATAAVPNPPLSPFPPVDIEPVSRDEKRLLLAQIIRANPLDCFDESGAFDLARAQRILPPGAVQSLTVHETTRTDKNGNTTVHRRITLRLVDKVRAMRLDDALEDKQEKAAHADALKKIAHLEKALTEADNRELQHSRDNEKKDRQIEALQRALKLAETTAAAAVGPEPVERVADSESPAPQPAESPVEQAEAQCRKAEEIAIQCRIREIEHSKNTSGHGGFSQWYPKWPQEAEAQRSYALRLIKAEAEAAERQRIASAQRAAELAARSARPPRRLNPMSFAAQGRERIIE